MEELYRAMRTFDDLMNAEENHIRLKMKPGDMVTVKNTRIMHGRSASKVLICRAFELLITRSELKGGISGRSLQVGRYKNKQLSYVWLAHIPIFHMTSPGLEILFFLLSSVLLQGLFII